MHPTVFQRRLQLLLVGKGYPPIQIRDAMFDLLSMIVVSSAVQFDLSALFEIKKGAGHIGALGTDRSTPEMLALEVLSALFQFCAARSSRT